MKVYQIKPPGFLSNTKQFLKAIVRRCIQEFEDGGVKNMNKYKVMKFLPRANDF